MIGPPPDLDAARQAKATLVEQLTGDERVVGIGIAYDLAADGTTSYQVKVNLARPEPDLTLPAEIAGVPVRTEVVGEIRPR